MPIPLYLAMTAAEFQHCDPLPEKIAWMACHFSPYGTGLSNCPLQLPEGSMLILNDRTPVCGHDPQRIAAELAKIASETACAGILLDLQHPGESQTAVIVQAVCNAAPCPVGVCENYWDKSLNAAVFLEPPPLHIPLPEYLAPWQNHTVWLEAATDTAEYILTEKGCRTEHLPYPPAELPHSAADSFCRYQIATEADRIRFCLHRSREDVKAMIEAAENVSLSVGLFQQLK